MNPNICSTSNLAFTAIAMSFSNVKDLIARFGVEEIFMTSVCHSTFCSVPPALRQILQWSDWLQAPDKVKTAVKYPRSGFRVQTQ